MGMEGYKPNKPNKAEETKEKQELSLTEEGVSS